MARGRARMCRAIFTATKESASVVIRGTAYSSSSNGRVLEGLSGLHRSSSLQCQAFATSRFDLRGELGRAPPRTRRRPENPTIEPVECTGGRRHQCQFVNAILTMGNAVTANNCHSIIKIIAGRAKTLDNVKLSLRGARVHKPHLSNLFPKSYEAHIACAEGTGAIVDNVQNLTGSQRHERPP